MMRRLWWSARVALGVGLIVTLVVGLQVRGVTSETLHVTASTSAPALAEAISRSPSLDLSYMDSLPPSRSISTLLTAAASRGSGVTIVVPGTVPTLSVTPPSMPIAMRRSSLTVTLRGEPGSNVRVTIDDPTGSADTVSVVIGASGIVSTSVAVEPTRAGATAWIVRARGESVAVHAWTGPEKAVRVLVLSGPPSWESRYFVRALESAGAAVSVHQALGRSQVVSSEDASLPASLADLDAFDVVALVGPVQKLSEALMMRWVSERGGGLLVVGPTSWSGALAPWSSARTGISGNAATLLWSGPAEVVPLPSLDLALDVAALPAGTPGVPVASSPNTPPATYAAAGWIGRGRIFASGIATWPWAMEAGLVREHAEHWESVVEWLAGGLTRDTEVRGGVGQPHVAWTGTVDGRVPSSVGVVPTSEPNSVPTSEPNSVPTSDLERLTPLRTPGGDVSLRFVPLMAGGYGLELDVGLGAEVELGAGAGPSPSAGPANNRRASPRAGAVIVEATTRVSWASAALEIGGAGGLIHSRAALGPTPAGRPLDDSSPKGWPAFLLLGVLAVTSWAARRMEGRP